MNTLAYLAARMKEASSWAGAVGIILGMAHVTASTDLINASLGVVAAAGGLIAVLVPEKSAMAAAVTRMLLFVAAGLAIAATGGLAACAGVPAAVLGAVGTAGTAYTVADKVTQAADPYIATACVQYQKGKAAADAVVGTGLVPEAVAGKVTSIESFGDAACANPPSGDPLSTAIWLGTLVGQITTLATPAQ